MSNVGKGLHRRRPLPHLWSRQLILPNHLTSDKRGGEVKDVRKSWGIVYHQARIYHRDAGDGLPT
jgi:hypothetical protein